MTENQKGRIMAGAVLAGFLWFASKRARVAPAPAPASSFPASSAPPVANEDSALSNRIAAGERDENVLTDVLFFGRHPERMYRPLASNETALQTEWLVLRDNTVRPALEWAGSGGASGSF